ncbi:MAG: triphosphoribosyl-dephospho-CoA synthase [Acidobacteria bacterium]|nr:triphosphoribosyl-dephospho-CoA synthase [Acidobacteriota bacterium]
MPPKTEKELALLIQMACVLESCAPKPGNVSRHHDFSDASLEDYLLSALAIGPAFENAAHASVGQIILDATVNTRRYVRSNTNLGMILLFAPLFKACLDAGDERSIRPILNRILNSLTVEDARLAYSAIRHAKPGGMGKVPQADIAEPPSISLLEAMALAQDRDSIAREYATGYEITFEIGLPAMKDALSRSDDLSNAAVHSFLTILSRVPDTLIARKKGMEAARMASRLAAEVLSKGGVFSREGREALSEMDRELRDSEHTLNPGTTADLTAAAIFLALFSRA